MRRKQNRALRYLNKSCAQSIMDAYSRREQRSEQPERLDVLRHCLAQLGENFKSLLEMRYAEGLSSAQIAVKLQRSASAIDMMMHRIKQRLIECVRRGAAGQESGS